jgi:CDP-diacylglycerol--glycerol-3-phosphate 3-phosphatidyltransferase
MNLPNKLTCGRLVLTVVFVAALSVEFPGAKALATVVFIIAAITDWLDGQIARKHNLITDFGKLMDPLADKVLTAAAFIGLVGLSMIPAWAVILIIAREFMITGLRLVAAAKNIVLPAEKLGKHKTTWQMVCIIYYLLLLCWRDYLTWFFYGRTPEEMVHELATRGWASPDPHGALAQLEAIMKYLSVAHGVGYVLLGVATFLTVWSGWSYLMKNKELFADA